MAWWATPQLAQLHPCSPPLLLLLRLLRRWPSMHEGLMPYRHRLRIQVRATQCKAPEGRTYWSDSVELDATVGGAGAFWVVTY